MTRSETEQRQREYWDVMPQWLRDAYHNEPLAHEAVQRCWVAEVPAGQLLEKVAEIFLNAQLETVKQAIDLSMRQHFITR